MRGVMKMLGKSQRKNPKENQTANQITSQRAIYRNIRKRRGYTVLLLTVIVLTLTLSAVMTLYSSAMEEYNSVRMRADYAKARFLAQSGLETAGVLIERMGTEYLYSFGVLDGYFPPPFPWEGGVISLRISEESGKLNLNGLVNLFDDSENVALREMLDRLADSFGFSYEKWDAVVDWIDENNVAMPAGYEDSYYATMIPPRRAKNGWMHSVDELLLIPGFDSWTLYEDFRTEEEKEMYSTDFLSEEEVLAVTDDDYILANNLTIYMPYSNTDIWKVNINQAPYHVILALTEYMTPEAAKAIIVERLKNGGYFSSLDELKNIPELQVQLSGYTLYDLISSRVVLRERIYKVVVDASMGSQSARIMGIYDPVAIGKNKYTLVLQ